MWMKVHHHQNITTRWGFFFLNLDHKMYFLKFLKADCVRHLGKKRSRLYMYL